MSKTRRFLLVGVIGLFPCSFASAAVFNLSDDFSIANGNPNGVWTYGANNQTFTSFTPYDRGMVIAEGRRWDSVGSYWDSVWRNDTTSTHYGVGPGQVSLHPHYNFNPSEIRFTAPASGEFHVVGAFLAGDSGTPSVMIRYNATAIDQGTDYLAFDFTRTMLAGETLGFAVFGYPVSANTPLDLTITGVPEPNALAVLALGGLALLRRRARG